MDAEHRSLRVEVEVVAVAGGPAGATLTNIVGPLDSAGWTGVVEPDGDVTRAPSGEQVTVRVTEGELAGQQATIHVDQTLSGGWPVTGITAFTG